MFKYKLTAKLVAVDIYVEEVDRNISLGAVSWSSKYMKSASKKEIDLSKVTPWVSNEIPNRFFISLTSFSQYNEYLWIGQEKAFVNEPVRVFII